jgi:hypothetical protein
MTVSASGIGSLLGDSEEPKLSRFPRTGDRKVLLVWLTLLISLGSPW